VRGRVEPARLGKAPTAVSDCAAERVTASPVPAMGSRMSLDGGQLLRELTPVNGEQTEMRWFSVARIACRAWAMARRP
jgi:hypothetical protein